MAQVNVNSGGTEGVVNGGWAVKHGIIGGIIAGIIFAMAEMISALIIENNFFGPLHMIAGIPLQKPPMQIDNTTAVVVGLITHMLYSMAAGVIVAFIVAGVPALRSSGTATIIFCAVLGFIIWPLNFYVIAPLINAPWFRDNTNPLLSAIWHTMFGLILGLYLASQLRKSVVVNPGVTRTTA